VDPNAPREFVDTLRDLGMRPREVGPRPTVPGMQSGLGVEGAAAFDEYVQRKAREIGLDLAALPDTALRAAPPAPGAPANPMAPADWNPRFVNGRRLRAFEFVQSQRRRYAMITRWAEYMRDLDMFIGAPTADIGATAQTGHPCVVVPYKFDVPVVPRPQGAAAAAAAPPQPAPALKPQPICAVVVGALFADDRILALAHQFQSNTDVHLQRPAL
jgi:hypothetical protein